MLRARPRNIVYSSLSSKTVRSGCPVKLIEKYCLHWKSSSLVKLCLALNRTASGIVLLPGFVVCHLEPTKDCGEGGVDLNVWKARGFFIKYKRIIQHSVPLTYWTAGHIRRPLENITIESVWPFSNHRAGSNFSGSGNTDGSICT